MSQSTQAAADASLQVLAISADGPTVRLMTRSLDGGVDRLSVATDLAEGLVQLASEVPDVLFIDVAMGKNAGLAVVHHARALAPNAVVYVLTTPDQLELAVQAVSLGAVGVLTLPVSGDEFLTALAQVRSRRAEAALRSELESRAGLARRAAELTAELTSELSQVTQAESRREATARILSVMLRAADAESGLVYLPAGERSRQLMRVAVHGDFPEAPSFCEELELVQHAAKHALEVFPMVLPGHRSGLVLLTRPPAEPRWADAQPMLEILATQSAAVLALLEERESHRSAMKDPGSSAYTFAYFVDIAGREIDKARRYGRRFALATISLGGEAAGPSAERAVRGRESAVELVERTLASVRDTDILARVDEREFYLLMPETGGLGAHTCRRKVLSGLRGSESHPGSKTPELLIGVATFPHDGSNLSQLLRVAHHRADAWHRSRAWRCELERVALGDLLDALFWTLSAEPARAGSGCEWPRRIEVLPMELFVLVSSAVSELARAGETRIVATERGSLGVASAVRAALERERQDVRFDAVDTSGFSQCRDLELISAVGQHGAYALIGRENGGRVLAVHAADPLFADFLLERLGGVVGARFLD
ncbi:MAG TPA: response regulator [Polyangiaceae bacterium]